MFFIDVPPQDYQDPWKSTFETRLAKLRGGQIRVAYFYETPDNSTFRYRVYNMIQALNVSGSSISASYFCNDDISKLRDIVETADIIVFCRTRYTDKIDQAITLAKCKGKRVFFDVDDYIFDTSFTHLILNTLDQDLNHPNVWDFWFAYMSRIGETLRRCDAAITTNQYLADRISAFTKLPVHVIPNFLNKEQIEISEKLYSCKRSSGFARTGNIHIGYFSGTPTHNRDFGIITGALTELLEQRTDVHLLVVGYMNLVNDLLNYASRIQVYPLHDFVNLQRIIAHVEINLIPLQDNEFTNCKSELKYFEAAVAGTISIASPVFTYENCIHDGVDGYLSRSYEWYDKITTAISALDQYPVLAEQALINTIERYDFRKQNKLIEKALSS